MSRTALLIVGALIHLSPLFVATSARAQATPSDPAPEGTRSPATPTVASRATPASTTDLRYHLGAHAEIDVGILLAMSQGTAIAGGVVWGPFRAGLSYASFLSNASFGGTPDGFTLRANYILGINASYFIGQSSDDGLYVQAMFHIKEHGITNTHDGAHRDLSSLAAGLELGYVWKVYRGLYVAPRVGALYYVKSPQGSDNRPVQIGDRTYDNSRHKVWDTYFIPTLSVGYSW